MTIHHWTNERRRAERIRDDYERGEEKNRHAQLAKERCDIVENKLVAAFEAKTSVHNKQKPRPDSAPAHRSFANFEPRVMQAFLSSCTQ